MLDQLLLIRTTDRDLAVRGRLLKGAALLMGIASLAGVVLLLTLPSGSIGPIFLWTLAAEVMVCVIVFWMAHNGAVLAGGLLLCLTLVATNVVASASGADPQSLFGLTGISHTFPVLVAGMVIGARAVPFFGVVPLMTLVLLALSGNPVLDAVGDVFINTLIAGMLWLIIHTLEGALAEARGQATAAEAAQRELATQQATLLATNQDLTSANEQMATLLDLVRDLEIPLIPVLEGVLVLPLVGRVDSRRADQITRAALEAIHELRARVVIVDLTGVPTIDTALVAWIGQLGGALRLLGARVLLTGLRPELAQVIATEGMDLAGIETTGRLQDGVALVLEGR